MNFVRPPFPPDIGSQGTSCRTEDESLITDLEKFYSVSIKDLSRLGTARRASVRLSRFATGAACKFCGGPALKPGRAGSR